MASGSFKIPTSNQYIEGELQWNSSTEVVNNRSLVNFTLYFYRKNGYRTYGSSGNWYVWIDGQRTEAHHSYDYPSSQAWVSVHSGSVWVGHNSDGNKQILIEVDGDTDTHDVYYANSSPWLDYIPRASTFNGGIDWTAGVDNFWISIDSKDASFHHTVEMFIQHTYDGNWDKVGERTWVGTSGWWNPTVAEITQIYTTNNMYEERPMLIRVKTYNSGHTAQIGTEQDKIGVVRAYAAGRPSLSNFNIGTTSVPVTVVNHHPNFTYEAYLYFGNFTKSWIGVGSTFNMTFTTTDINSLYAQIPNANSGIGELIIRTKYNGVLIEDGIPNTNKQALTLSVVNSNPVFSTIQYADINTAITAITGNNQYIVQNKSTVEAKVLNANKAVAQNQSTITKYVATLNGATVTVTPPFATDIVFNFGVVNASININLQITAYDSRGNTTVVTKAVNIVPWQLPTTNVSAPRENGFGSAVTLSLSGSISPVNVAGVNKNALVASGVNYRTRPVGGTWSTAVQFNSQALTMPNFTTANVALTMATTTAYEIEVQVTDKFGNRTVLLTVPIGVPLLMLDEIKNAFGIGKFPSRSNVLDVAYDVDVGGWLSSNGKRVIGNEGVELSDGNLNNCFRIGRYTFNNTTVGRPPTSNYGVVEVYCNNGIEWNGTNNWIWQVAYTTDTPSKVFVRNRVNAGVWTPWTQIGGVKPTATLSSGGQALAANTWYRVDWTVSNHNEGYFFDDNINQFYVAIDGYYEIMFWTYFVQSIGTGFYLELWSTTEVGFSNRTIVSTWAPANGYNFYHGSNIAWLKAGNYYELVIKHSDTNYTRNTLDMKCTFKLL